MKMLLSEFKQKYPNLILSFEKTTGKHTIWGGRVTGNFKYFVSICLQIFENKELISIITEYYHFFLINFRVKR